MIGGGPICVELAQALARLGVRVTILQRGPRLLAREEPELAERLTARLRGRARRDRHGRRGRPRRASTADRDEDRPRRGAVVAGGGGLRRHRARAERRRPRPRGGRREGRRRRASSVDASLRTSVKSIYAAGDVAGPPSLHPRRRLRGGARGAQHVLAGPQPRRVPRAVVHVHRSRARPRRADGGAGARAARRRRGAASGARTSRTPTAPARTPPTTASCGSSRRRAGSSAPTCWRRPPAS